MTTKGILIISHTELLALAIRALISETSSFHVVAHANEEDEILKYQTQFSPDLVVIDIDTDRYNSTSTIQKLKTHWPDTKILSLTERTDEKTLAEYVGYGCDGVCLKSSQAQHLLSAMDAVSLGALWIDPACRAKVKEFIGKTNKQKKVDLNTESRFGTMFQCLSRREMEVLELIVKGHTNSQIAERLSVSSDTIKTHVRHIYEKLSVKHRAEAVVTAIKLGLVPAA